jgi:hypothetical protein
MHAKLVMDGGKLQQTYTGHISNTLHIFMFVCLFGPEWASPTDMGLYGFIWIYERVLLDMDLQGFVLNCMDVV